MQQLIETESLQKNVVAIDATPISAKVATQFRARISALSDEASAWEATVYTNSNNILYSLIQKSYELYKELTSDGDGNLKHRKQALTDFLMLNGLDAYVDKPLASRIIRSVFGNKDRRRISTYTTVLKFIVKQGFTVAEVPQRISELGGVQEISLGRAGNALTPKQKASIANQKVAETMLASVSSDALSKLVDAETKGEKFAAVLTQESDGSFSINCVVHSNAAVNATLVAFYSANKERIAVDAKEQKLSNAQINSDELTRQAIAA